MTEPPIVPGNPQPEEPPSLPAAAPPVAPAPVRRRRTLLLVAAGSVVAMIAAGVTVGLIVVLSETPLHKAQVACNAGELSENDHALFLDTAGRDSDSGSLSPDDVFCVLNNLGAPSYVRNAMEQTSSIQGRQSQRWGDFEASWTYHPAAGLDLVIREVG